MAEIKEEQKISTARACRIVSLDRSMFYYAPIRDDAEVEARPRYYSVKLPSRGCPEYYKRMRKEGYTRNHKKAERVYNKLWMNTRRGKVKRRIRTLIDKFYYNR
ncbi:MAG: hypothetical protein AB7S54_01230 [Bacteroidales bacterium]